MIRYVLDKDIKWVYPIGSDFSKEQRIDIPREKIFVDILDMPIENGVCGIAKVKLYFGDGNVGEFEVPQTQFMDCFRLKDCADKTNYKHAELPLVPAVLFDGRFNS